MNELQLSNDLNQIELEINYHKSLAGQSIWEIGRRLNHVKEHDLAHGQFRNWLEHINIDYRSANKMMVVADKLPNVTTSSHLGTEVLYLIATLPEEQKEEQLERAEEGDAPTVRELRELKRQNREKDEIIKGLQSQPPKEKVVEKKVEVVPDDYDQIKNENARLSDLKTQAEEREQSAKQELERLYKEREEVDKNAKHYEELKHDIENAERKKELSIKKIKEIDNYRSFATEIDNMLGTLASLLYQADFDLLDDESIDYNNYRNLVNKVRQWCDDADAKLDKREIIEGEIIE